VNVVWRRGKICWPTQEGVQGNKSLAASEQNWILVSWSTIKYYSLTPVVYHCGGMEWAGGAGEVPLRKRSGRHRLVRLWW